MKRALHLFTEERNGLPFITLAVEGTDGTWRVLMRHVLDCGSSGLQCTVSHIAEPSYVEAMATCPASSLHPEIVIARDPS